MTKSSKIALLLAAFLAAPPLVFADFSYQQTTQITGGSLVSVFKTLGVFSSQARHATDPITSSIYLKGNQLAHVSPDAINIIDLDKETVTDIDLKKKTYTTMTFEQMKQAAAEAERKAEAERAKHPEAQQPSEPADNNVKASFDVKVKKTGATRQVSGFETQQAILTMMMNATDTKTSQTGSMGITDDMWLAPEPAGYGEVRDFYTRFAQKMGMGVPGGGMDLSRVLASQPGANQALADLTKEMQKLQGVPVLQIMRMGMTTDGQPLPAASEAPLPDNSSGNGVDVGGAAKQGAQDSASSEIKNQLGKLGGFGGFGGFGHKKKSQPPPPPPEAKSDQAQPTSAVLLETKSESSNFSSAPVDPSHFEIPAGFREVKPKMN